ncbi:winged helix-turn-helix transcriptional regulator (plasmid) [Peribacillus psychrosaccharolyticus]|uniref:Winged helix-turn-helix transcriptional regulator n=1 Tax=Peribacillus psychrosaccharolyticus TaxID=1407 RepID=A0A974NIZ6_PERPY|nr:winged helix-turn-helix domain-containing protein [Peribacillus psychrosaccharolyticus]MEC2054251.1 winged helix-turn-helix domain-containing protein [Peribacillus psychrosaccharolyticus]MED3746654.1 winged helix-turn-helix domain-containing protein [Peribacillus psychrosaccharolyticus]QQS98447.1 winged helix-turn-helix transcriptional regulator [Peribacillus psychrosaccharolyticus]
MKQMLTLTEHSQLKALSDPLRAEMMMRLLERPYTGQQLSVYFNLSRAKVHYHLKELEKNQLIAIVKKEEKNGIIQKFYQSVARGFTPSAELLPHLEDINETSRQFLLQMAERTKSVILSAPEDAFKMNKASEDPSDWDYIGSMWQFSAKEEHFKDWIKKYFALMQEFSELTKQDLPNHPDSKIYYISTMAFQIDEPIMEELKSKKEEK